MSNKQGQTKPRFIGASSAGWGIVCLALLCAVMPASYGAWVNTGIIQNGGFETDAVPVYPGYTSVVTGWSAESGSLLNNATGPFYTAALGPIPQGTKVYGRQGVGTLSQALSGLADGRTYRLDFYVNCREPIPTFGTMDLEVKIGSETIYGPTTISPTNPFRFIQAPFLYDVAWGSTLSFNFSNSTGDSTLLLDGVTLYSGIQVEADSPTFVIVAPGDDPVTFWINVWNHTGTLQYQWYDRNMNPVGGNFPYLTVAATEENRGSYWCQVYDTGTGESAASPSFRLIVGALPVTGLFGLVLTGVAVAVIGIGAARKRR